VSASSIFSPTTVPRVVFATLNNAIYQTANERHLDSLLLPTVDDDSYDCNGQYSSNNLYANHHEYPPFC
jgi:hypothetical protein